jgi:hypothetical protein
MLEGSFYLQVKAIVEFFHSLDERKDMHHTRCNIMLYEAQLFFIISFSALWSSVEFYLHI